MPGCVPDRDRLLAVFLRSISKQRAQPMQLLRPGFGPFGEHDARAARQRVDIAAAMSLHGNCCLSASPGSCQIAT
jgi:hypothetical protein